MEKLLTPQEVAKVLAVTPRTVEQLIRTGRLLGVKISKFWRIKEEELERFIEEHSISKIEPLNEGELKPEFFQSIKYAERDIKTGKTIPLSSFLKEHNLMYKNFKVNQKNNLNGMCP